MLTFKKSDVVTLKSGGPKMTVNKVQDDGTLWCIWFDDKHVQQGAEFDPSDLEIVPRERTIADAIDELDEG
jgi:uncharacterized protein YodC (DUF2158 family)